MPKRSVGPSSISSGRHSSNLWQIQQNQNMNHKPYSFAAFPGLAFLTSLATLVAIALQQVPAESADEKPGTAETAASDKEKAAETKTNDTVPATNTDPVPTATDLLNQTRGKLQSLESLKCDLHETVIMAGMTLHAAGTYAEASGNRVHLMFQIFPSQPAVKSELKGSPIDAEPATLDPATARGELTQVSDGTVLFTLWKNGPAARVSRRNLRDIMAAATQVAGYDENHVAMDLGVGGIRGLIARIESLMEFAPVQTKKVGDSDLYVVRGRWNAKTRKEIFQLPADAIVDPRPHIPEYVVFYIDAKTLLPRRIEYRKRASDPAQKFDRPMVTLDLRNIVLNEAIPDELFVFSAPEGVPEDDVTEKTIQAIQQSAQRPQDGKAPATAPPNP